MEITLHTTLRRATAADSLGMQISWHRGHSLTSVASVLPGGAGHEAGLLPGDILRDVNGHASIDGILNQLVHGPCKLDVCVERWVSTAACQAPLPSLPSCSTIAEAAQLCHINPNQILARSITLRETDACLGIYMELHHTGGLHLKGHATIAHWRPHARRSLTEDQYKCILNRARALFVSNHVFVFSLPPPVALGRRAIVTFHAQSKVHAELFALHNTAAQFVVARREAWRQNFHLSVDGVLRGVKGEGALGPDEPSEESVELGAAALCCLMTAR